MENQTVLRCDINCSNWRGMNTIHWIKSLKHKCWQWSWQNSNQKFTVCLLRPVEAKIKRNTKRMISDAIYFLFPADLWKSKQQSEFWPVQSVWRPGYHNREKGKRYRSEPVPETGIRRHRSHHVHVSHVGLLPDDSGLVQRRRRPSDL